MFYTYLCDCSRSGRLPRWLAAAMGVDVRTKSKPSYVHFENSGAVSVRLKDYLQSDAGKQQLKAMKELRPNDTPSVPGVNSPRK